MTDWTPEEDEAFNEVEKNSNLGKQILRGIDGQPYVYPPKREWVGLTDEEMLECLKAVDVCTAVNLLMGQYEMPPTFKVYAEAIQSKLKEKNVRTL